MSNDTQVQPNNRGVQTETPYAVAKLGESTRVIRQVLNELPALRKKLEKNIGIKPKAREIYSDIQILYRNLQGAFDTASLSLLEAGLSDMASYSVNLSQSLKSFNLMTPDYSKLCGALSNFLSGLPQLHPGEANADTDLYSGAGPADETQTTNARVIGRLMNNVRMGYYPTCTDNLAHIVKGMDLPEGIAVNLLDPCCGCGIALHFLAEGVIDKGNVCKTYGIELDGHRAEEALTRVNRVGFGSFYHSRISNEAFHAMLLNPPYLSVMTMGSSNARSERMFLVDSINRLMIGGLLIYVIPYYRLTADIVRILCDNFSNVSVWKFTSDEFMKFRQVAILGTRHKRRDGSGEATALASLALSPDSLPELTELPYGHYRLPAVDKEVALFKGALFNESELADQLSNSKSLSRRFQRSGLDKTSKRPLLPLSLGQIGLVGGSGLINGPVDCDTPHIIKGRIIKEKRAGIEENRNHRGELTSTTVTETTSNKLIFNLLTPKGFMSLTDYSGVGSLGNRMQRGFDCEWDGGMEHD